ncbi:MAG TPA: peptidoglycan-associated lipoprotein Pal [Usitatibacter sp.]|nr:peptidoglycan-associated lipoprotein Pal [Usitatibacter sp.]
MKHIALCTVLLLALAGCAKDQKEAKVEDHSTPGTQQTAPRTEGTGSTTRPTNEGNITGNPLTDPSSPLSKRSVYFDFDSNEVKDEYRGLLQAHARYIADHRDARVRIEGNTDERGSREYNLALGQRRAEAVKRVMTVLGADGNRIETISYGEEKPKSQGHDEAAWAENRRADIRYAGE